MTIKSLELCKKLWKCSGVHRFEKNSSITILLNFLFFGIPFEYIVLSVMYITARETIETIELFYVLLQIASFSACAYPYLTTVFQKTNIEQLTQSIQEITKQRKSISLSTIRFHFDYSFISGVAKNPLQRGKFEDVEHFANIFVKWPLIFTWTAYSGCLTVTALGNYFMDRRSGELHVENWDRLILVETPFDQRTFFGYVMYYWNSIGYLTTASIALSSNLTIFVCSILYLNAFCDSFCEILNSIDAISNGKYNKNEAEKTILLAEAIDLQSKIST